jgi:perosamine synthetase
MDVSLIESKITPRTKAIMVVHTYGHPVDMDKVRAIADKHKLYVIEDAAEAHGATYKGRKAGSLGDIAAFSFYANKLVTCGEGGMVVTDNGTFAERARNLRNHFFGKKRYIHPEVGYNYRLTNVQAAIGCAQLERIDALVDARRKNAQLYNSLLRDVRGITLPSEKEWAKNVYWMYGVLVQPAFGTPMLQLCEELLKQGIETRTFFVGMHKQPAYLKHDARFPDLSGRYPVSDELEAKGFYLPSSSHLTPDQIRFVVKKIREIGHGN